MRRAKAVAAQPDGPDHEGISGVNAWWLATALAAVVIPPALGATHLTVLGIFAFAVILWVTSAVPAAVTGLAVVVLLPALGVSDMDAALTGFAAPSLWLLIGVFILSEAVRQTEVDVRVAARLVQVAGTGPVRVLAAIVGMLFLLLFMVPTSSGRTAIVTPLVQGLMTKLGVHKGSAYGQVVFITIAFVAIMSSTALLTGAAVAIYAEGFLAEATGTGFTWISWSLLMFPVAAAAALTVAPLVWWKLSPSPRDFGTSQAGPSTAIPVTAEQWRLGALLVVVVGMYATSGRTGLDLTLITLAAALLSVAPVVGVVRWSQVRNHLPWDLVLLYGGAFALSSALARSDALDPLVVAVTRPLADADPVVTALAVLVLMSVVRLGFTSIVAATAIVLPVVIAMARILGLNPTWLGLVAVLGSSLGLFLPTQSVAGMIVFATGYVDMRTMAKAAVPVVISMAVLTLLFARFYWPLMGLTIRAGS